MSIEIKFDDHSVEDLKDLQTTLRTYLRDKKEELKLLAKEQKKAIKAANEAAGKAIVIAAGVGGEVTVNYKETTVTGTITKIKENGRTFHLDIMWEGESSNVWRYFDQVVIPETTEDSEEE